MPSPTLGGGSPIMQKIVRTPVWPLPRLTRSVAFPPVAGGGGSVEPGKRIP